MLAVHRLRFLGLLSVAIVLFGLGNACPAVAETVLQVKSFSGAKLRTLLTGDPMTAKANIVLLVGGSGVLKISGKGQIKSTTENFLVRTRKFFAEAGFLTAVVDAPMDRRKPPGLLGGFRASEEHARDLAKVVKQIGALNGKPVIVIGTSRGTVSAANVAIRDKSGAIKAVVLTSSLVKPNRKGKVIQDLPLNTIKVPILFVHNKNDRCKTTLLKNVRPIFNSLQKSGAKAELLVVGSKKRSSKNCGGNSPHGFFTIEQAVTTKIINWVKSRL